MCGTLLNDLRLKKKIHEYVKWHVQLTEVSRNYHSIGRTVQYSRDIRIKCISLDYGSRESGTAFFLTAKRVYGKGIHQKMSKVY